MNLADLAKIAASEEAAIKWVEDIRWPDGAVCPKCGVVGRGYRLATRPGLWKCGACRKQFTVRVGTIFEDSHIPLSKWLLAIHLMCSSKKGVSAKQVERALGLSYKSAWFLCHRIRYAMTQQPLAGLLGEGGGTVEADETYIGGKPSNNKHKGHKPTKKMVVMTLVERDGEARTFHVPNNKGALPNLLLQMNVSEEAHLVTDSAKAYQRSKVRFPKHEQVNHAYEYVRGIVHTNFAESYHSLLKRGIFGTYHHVSSKHLARYLREFEFRWNSRKATDGARMTQAVSMAEGKRLTYRAPKGRPTKPV